MSLWLGLPHSLLSLAGYNALQQVVDLKGPFIWNDTKYNGDFRGSVNSRNQPEGDGDYKGSGGVYRGSWHGGKPFGKGWWRDSAGTYAGEVDGLARHGRGTFWSPDGRSCFEGSWINDSAVGEGTMLREDGELWLVRFDTPTRLVQHASEWDQAIRTDLLGRVAAGVQAPVAQQADRGVATVWDATVVLADGREIQWRFRSLTQVRSLHSHQGESMTQGAISFSLTL